MINNTEWKRLNSDLRLSSVQWGVSTAADKNFTPESFRSLSLRSSSFRVEDWERRTEDRTSQLFSERLQVPSLKNKENKDKHTEIIMLH